jgi:hypothetical protein
MGKLKKYLTDEERKEAYRLSSKMYYWKNKDRIDKKQKEKYHELRKNIQSDNRESEI